MAEADARKLLDFIITNPIATLEEKKAEFSSHAVDRDDQSATMAGHEVQTETDAAVRLFPAFYAGLRHAGAAGGPQAGALVLDDADPQQNAMAEALIRFLVKPHLATVETEELGETHYRYHITLDWPGLQRTATLAGVPLDAALAG